MHELPKDLGNSLRSFRNSVHRHSGQHDFDLEKLEAPADQLSAESNRQANETSSSLILHPIVSRQALSLSIAAQNEQAQVAEEGLSRPISRPSHHNHASGTPFTPKRPLLTAPKVADPDPAADRLDDDETPLAKEDFYRLMGMKPPVSESDNPAKLGMKNGMYTRIASKYEYINTKYRIFDVLTYALLVLQLLLGAVFIVLGSLTGIDSHVSIAILGALSTVTAGALALMKGQGLPNRLHQMRDDLHNVKFEAEELYWDVAAGRAVLYRDIRKLREDYLRVMEDGRRNHPDTWNAAAQQVATGVHSFASKSKTGFASAAVPGKPV
ncbi:hypothetical protein MBLNU13_g04877t1 [Cladosporium sp. NU13]